LVFYEAGHSYQLRLEFGKFFVEMSVLSHDVTRIVQ
jgi:hypothetical protein